MAKRTKKTVISGVSREQYEQAFAEFAMADAKAQSLTAKMDQEMTKIREKYADQLGKHTLLLVTHRASLLTLVDRLIVMDNGQIIADGPKEQVMQALSGGKLHVAKG